MANKKGKGLLALLGIGAGAWAFWKYKSMSPGEKEELKAKISDAGEKLKKTVNDLDSTVSDEFENIKNSTKQKVDKVIK